MSALPAMDPAECAQIALPKAVLCEDCQTVSDTPYPYCPACGSQALLQLARVLNRVEEPAHELTVVRSGEANVEGN